MFLKERTFPVFVLNIHVDRFFGDQIFAAFVILFDGNALHPTPKYASGSNVEAFPRRRLCFACEFWTDLDFCRGGKNFC